MAQKPTYEELEQRIKVLEKEMGTYKGLVNVPKESKKHYRRTEQALRESEERLQLAADAAQMGQWDWNILTGEVVWSQQCLAHYGLPSDTEMSYDRFVQAVHPEDRDRIDHALHRAVEDRTGYDEVKRTVWPDGSIHWTHSRGQVYCDTTGQPIRMIGVTFDITKRKMAEEALKESEAKYMDLYENAPDMYVSVNAQTALIEGCNTTLANTLGYSKEQIIGRPVFDIYHSDCLKEVKETFKLFVETGEVHDKELQLHRKDGSKLDVSLNASAVRGQNGQILFSRSTLRDITDRKRAEEAYRISVSRFEDLFNKATIPLCFINKETTMLNVNAQFEKTFGYSQEEIPTLNEWWQLAYPDPIYRKWVIDKCNAALQRAVKANTNIEPIEYRVTCKNGDILTMVVFGSFIEHELLLTFFDITDHKRNHAINAARLHLLQFAETHSVDELLEETLNEAEKITESLIGFYHFVENDQTSLTLQSWSAKTKAQFCKAEGKGLHYPIAEAGVWVDCVHQGEPVIHNDYASLPHRKGMPQGHAEVIRELVVPVLRGNRITAILGVGNKPTDYTKKDVETLSLLADLAWEIAERKQAESDLKESDERYRAIVAGFDGLIYICSQDYRVEFMNDKFIERTGYYPIGEMCYKALHELDDVCPWCVNERVFNGETVRWEVKSPKDDRWYYVVNTPLYHADGGVSKQAMILDITERKQTEEELDKYREHLEELVQERTAKLEEARNKAQLYLDIAGVILVAIDADRRVSLINQKGCEILGTAAGEIIGKDWFETFVPENIRQDVIQAFDRLMAGEIEPVEHFENTVLTQSGQERLIAWHNAFLRDDQGNIVGTLSSGEDITEQRRAEEEITSLNQDLLNRTAALEAANKDLEAFAYSVSHDLRAPLRHIDGFLELLQKRTATALDERSRHYMDTIADSAKHMGALIDDLLSFSRMARHQITKQHVDLNELTRDIIQEFEPETVNRHIHWHVDDLPEVTGDRAMLRMVLVNLISNALKFTRTRQKTEIEIRGLRGQEAENVIFVRDNGVGFDMNYADKLFSVFQRLHRVEEFEGTGIGLANVRRIIARHGGRTWATGELNQGATFYFSLPLT